MSTPRIRSVSCGPSCPSCCATTISSSIAQGSTRRAIAICSRCLRACAPKHARTGRRRNFARFDNASGLRFVQSIDLAQAEPQCRLLAGSRPVSHAGHLQCAIPVGMADVGLARLDAVLDRVAHDLCRGVEAHGCELSSAAAKAAG